MTLHEFIVAVQQSGKEDGRRYRICLDNTPAALGCYYVSVELDPTENLSFEHSRYTLMMSTGDHTEAYVRFIEWRNNPPTKSIN